MRRSYSIIEIMTVIAVLCMIFAVAVQAQNFAIRSDVGEGQANIGMITNAAASLGPYIGGNIPEAAVTNAAASLGDDIGGNIPEAALTNAAASLGDDIGGNIPLASLTNAVSATPGPARIWLGSDGYLQILNGTNLVIVDDTGAATNSLDADITSP